MLIHFLQGTGIPMAHQQQLSLTKDQQKAKKTMIAVLYSKSVGTWKVIDRPVNGMG